MILGLLIPSGHAFIYTQKWRCQYKLAAPWFRLLAELQSKDAFAANVLRQVTRIYTTNVSAVLIDGQLNIATDDAITTIGITFQKYIDEFWTDVFALEPLFVDIVVSHTLTIYVYEQ
jgi:hypothetical protein